MAKTTSERRGSSASGLRDHEWVAVVAAQREQNVIAGILESQSSNFEAFQDADMISLGGFSDEPRAIVLWIKDAITVLAGRVEPLDQRFERTPIIVVCSSIDRWGIRALLKAGAAGIVLSEAVETVLAPCLLTVKTGQICVPREHWKQIEPPALSSREKQILGLVVMGDTNAQIAQRLFLAESTVKSHLSSAFGKLGVRSRNEAVHLILDSERGFGMGILALGVEPLEPESVATR